MKVFVAGGSGAIGRRLVPELVARGHEVLATTTKPERAAALAATGARPLLLDILDAEAVIRAVDEARAQVVVHQATALAGPLSLRRFDDSFALTNRLRTEGTDNLLAAAVASGAERFVAQSFSGWPNAREGGPLKTEADRLDPDPPANARTTFDAIRTLEAAVTGCAEVGGVVLRYGGFYGPGTSIGDGGELVEAVRRRKLPLVGNGAGVWSFLHIDDAVTATVAAIEGRGLGVYNVVDDDPAPVAEWLPYLARVIGAKPPRRIPVWLARRELEWQPAWPTWRDGFVRGLSAGEHRSARAA
jgi:2-alkyl-3-oxoalkanoate reductase